MRKLPIGTKVWPIAVPTRGLTPQSRWWAEPVERLTREMEISQEFNIPNTEKFSRFQRVINGRPNTHFMYTLFRKSVITKSKKTKKQIEVIGFIYAV